MYLHFICGWFKKSCPVNVVAYSFLIRGREGHRQEQVPIFPWPDTRDARAVARTDHHHSAPTQIALRALARTRPELTVGAPAPVLAQ